MNLFFRRRFQPNFLYEGEKDKGGGGISAKVDWPPEVIEGFKNLVSKKGGEKDAAMTLFEENYELRKKNRDLEDEIENKTVLSEEEAERYDKYKELGDDPEKLKEKIDNAETTKQELQKLKREKQHGDVAEVMGWKQKVLTRLSDEDAEFEIKTRKNDEGEDEKYAVIKTEDGEKDLSEYARENWEEFMPALKTNGSEESESSGSGESQGKTFTKQSSSSKGKSNEGGYLDKWKNSNKKAAGIKEDDEK